MIRLEPRLIAVEGRIERPNGHVVGYESGYSTGDLPVKVRLAHFGVGLGRHLWVFRGRVYSAAEEFSALDAKALLLEQENKHKMKVARARALMEQVEIIEGPRREPISDATKILVWQRDGGKCVRCGSNRNLEYDHVIPVSMGGSNTARNLQLLCETCNRAKGGNLA